MALDLAALDYAQTALSETAELARQADGKAREFPLDVIDEDPDQPRKEFDSMKLAELAASIKESGVLQPITIKLHPELPGRYVIRYGARRYRASKLAGKTTIPAFIADQGDEYAQVIENEQRDNLTALELATFIQKRIAAGDSKTEIAKRLGKPPKFVTEHLALIDMPDCIADAYAHKTQSPATICNLRALHKRYPEAVESWCLGQAEITRRTVDLLARELQGHSQKVATPSPPSPEAHMTRNGTDSGISLSSDDRENASSEPSPPHSRATRHDRKQGSANVAASDEITDPVLLVKYDGTVAAVLLERRPTRDGLIHIRTESDGAEVEVEARVCTIVGLEDRREISS